MAICRRPGTVVDFILPSDEGAPEEDKTHVGLKVPTEEEYRRILALERTREDNPREMANAVRETLSIALDYIRNLKFEGGGEFELDRDKSGQITKDSLSVLFPFFPEIMTLYRRCSRLTEAEQKNF